MAYKYNDGSRTDELIKKMIPVLVRWAQSSWDCTHYYSDLQEAIGAKTPRLGWQLGVLNDLFWERYHGEVPTLNALVVSMNSGLPSDGFGYVDDSYENLSKDAKKAYMKDANIKAHEYNWEPVLKDLGLQPSTILDNSTVREIRKKITSYGNGGESYFHENLKNRIALNPSSIGLGKIQFTETERSLLSGDRLDVYFETEMDVYAIEVKSNISDDNDILRGIFQCIKYQAVLEKEQVFEERHLKVHTILVIEGKLNDSNRQLVQDFGIHVIENYK